MAAAMDCMCWMEGGCMTSANLVIMVGITRSIPTLLMAWAYGP